MAPVNVAIIGCGYWGPNVIRNFNQLSEAKVMAICDLDEKRLNDIGQLYPSITRVKDYKQLLADPEIHAVIIATPIHTHHKLAKEALEAGKNVWVEKPMTKHPSESRELIDLAKKHEKILMVGHTFEYSPPVNKVKELIASGAIGKLAHIEVRRQNLGRLQSDYDVIWDLAPHDISIIHHATGLKIQKARAITHKGYLMNNPGSVAQVDLLLDNNVSAHLSLSWISPKKTRDMTFIGDKKMILYDDADPVEKIKIYDKGVDHKFSVGEVATASTIYREGDIHIPYVNSTEPLRLQCLDFVKSITNKGQPGSHGEVGHRVVKVLDAIERSVQSGGVWVNVDYD